MKTVFKYYILPFLLLIILNGLLFLFIKNYQQNTSERVDEISNSNNFLSLIYDGSAKLDQYLLSGSFSDSLEYAKALDEIFLKTENMGDIFPEQTILVDSLEKMIQEYAESLDFLEQGVTDREFLNYEGLLELGSNSRMIQQDIQQLIIELNNNNTASLALDLDDSERILSSLFIIYLIIFMVVLLIAYQFFIRPLVRLRKEIQNLPMGSSNLIEIDRDDEIGELINAFNKTSISLERSEQELIEANQKLKMANKELESFAYSVSHDLRSPLRSISGFSDALVNKYSDELSEKAQDYLDRVNKAAQKMGELIDDILKLSRVTRAEINMTEINVTDLTKELLELLSVDADSSYTVNIEENLKIEADKALFKVFLLNLLSNATKFSGSKTSPEIKVGKKIKNGVRYLYVKDNGIGFDMKYSDKIFGAFQRLHAESEYQGTGIGLATVKRIINKHGGDIFMESEKGKGTTVYFNFGKG